MVQASRVVLVTGSSSGIGLATAVAFARAGDVVLASMRDVNRSEPLQQAALDAGIDVEIVQLDVTENGSIERCVDDAVAEHGRIDVLVNNAGVGFAGTLEELSDADLRRSIEVNFLGVANMTRAVLPIMRGAGRGRIIAVGSISGALGQPFNDAYCAAKFAVEGLYEALHPVAAAFGIHLSLVEPGPVTGEFRERSGGVDGRNGSGPFADLHRRFLEVADAGYETAQTPDEVAAVILEAADAEVPKLRYQTSEAIERLVGVKLADLSGERVTRLTRRWLTSQ
jgi:NAD(P)-dependent dehydrogenase (short-subunit alcohol dehydrogenase family)